MTTRTLGSNQATTVAEIIAAAIVRADRSQKWVAERAGIPLTTFRRKLRGGNAFTVAEVIAIALALGVDPADLLMPVVAAADDVAAIAA
ncbi:MAG: helix-turn-helix transcriptional regulator [Microbacterium ginsengisoli]|uniref:helix-turn-helix domain-containing protein n=1 Tax=Microbacterium TaxID=33882 RepID=UPI0006FA1AB9|nr:MULTISPECIES: helix-turn-helix transcriptional regulator [unclassified Microbacterium]KQR90986.1 hypothetical protein ASF93_08705 [Microbacterium sp. Leaf347]KQS00016.1 hypothetical protein ASG00_11015 [Microbacterium sp. Leaf351]MBN9199719.1 helix-turn-helix transcriptional regulator [Microbacterium ginsengisoli]OJU75245.1 MAG: hypothetical protein BGO15_04250 [Microbacterium sp. 71-23]